MELETYSKLVISFMNRKSSCGYATHFLIPNSMKAARSHDDMKVKVQKQIKITCFAN
jgi:hypothetical protein